MKLIVGLGNPGTEYNNTKHNLGFLCIDNYAKSHNIVINKEKFNGLYNEFFYNNEKIILLKPQSFINLSGEVIRKYIDYYNIDINDILIINDDLDLEVGKFKLKYKGTSGGHNGLKNIELNLKTQEYKRLKIGISNNKEIDTKDYVLSKISSDDMKEYIEIFNLSISILNDFITLDFETLVSKYNRK